MTQQQIEQLAVIATTAKIVAMNGDRRDVYQMRMNLYANEMSGGREISKNFEFYYKLGIIVDQLAWARWPDWQNIFAYRRNPCKDI